MSTTIESLDRTRPETPEHTEERRRDVRQRSTVDHATLVGSALAGLGLVWVGYEKLLPTSGTFGFIVCWYLAFLLIYVLVTMQRHGWVDVSDRLAAAVMHTGALVTGGALTLVVVYTIFRGLGAMRYLNFFTDQFLYDDPTNLREAGILHAIIGTLEQVGIAIVITLPLGVACAVFMSEVRGRLATVVRTMVEAMTALPSIVAGLFILTAVILTGGLERSGLAAALALSVMMLPIITRAADVVLRLVPNGLREASLALGASQWQTVRRVVLPTARPGLATALILGIARGVGETSPVLLTAGYTQFINANPLEGYQTSLPLFVYQVVNLPDPEMKTRAFGAASALLIIVLTLFVLTRIIAARRPGGRQ